MTDKIRPQDSPSLSICQAALNAAIAGQHERAVQLGIVLPHSGDGHQADVIPFPQTPAAAARLALTELTAIRDEARALLNLTIGEEVPRRLQAVETEASALRDLAMRLARSLTD